MLKKMELSLIFVQQNVEKLYYYIRKIPVKHAGQYITGNSKKLLLSKIEIIKSRYY